MHFLRSSETTLHCEFTTRMPTNLKDDSSCVANLRQLRYFTLFFPICIGVTLNEQ